MTEGWHVQDTRDAPVEIVIGMRWSALWRLVVNPWVPVAFAGMVRPDRHEGLLASRLRVTRDGPAISQDWQNRAALDDWSRASGAGHLEPWKRFAKEAGGTADWGIWHRVHAS